MYILLRHTRMNAEIPQSYTFLSKATQQARHIFKHPGRNKCFVYWVAKNPVAQLYRYFSLCVAVASEEPHPVMSALRKPIHGQHHARRSPHQLPLPPSSQCAAMFTHHRIEMTPIEKQHRSWSHKPNDTCNMNIQTHNNTPNPTHNYLIALM